MSEQKPVEELPTPSMEDDAERVTVLKRVPGDELEAGEVLVPPRWVRSHRAVGAGRGDAMTMYFAVFATRRADLSEWIVSLVSTEAMVAWKFRGTCPDAGASSDGDRSWAQEPVTQDPDADRSVDAAIRRTGGR